MEYSGARGKLIHEKNQKQKVSWRCPFKLTCQRDPPSCWSSADSSTPWKPENKNIFFCLLAYTLLNWSLVSIRYKYLYWTYIIVLENKYRYLIFEWMFQKKILIFQRWENINWKCICLIEIWITWSQKEWARTHSQIPNIYFKKEITNSLQF